MIGAADIAAAVGCGGGDVGGIVVLVLVLVLVLGCDSGGCGGGGGDSAAPARLEGIASLVSVDRLVIAYREMNDGDSDDDEECGCFAVGRTTDEGFRDVGPQQKPGYVMMMCVGMEVMVLQYY